MKSWALDGYSWPSAWVIFLVVLGEPYAVLRIKPGCTQPEFQSSESLYGPILLLFLHPQQAHGPIKILYFSEAALTSISVSCNQKIKNTKNSISEPKKELKDLESYMWRCQASSQITMEHPGDS